MNLWGWISTQVGLGLLRQALTAVGSVLVANGLLNDAQTTTIVGALVTIISVVASVVANRNAAKAQAVVKAVDAHPGIERSTDPSGKPRVDIVPKSLTLP